MSGKEYGISWDMIKLLIGLLQVAVANDIKKCHSIYLYGDLNCVFQCPVFSIRMSLSEFSSSEERFAKFVEMSTYPVYTVQINNKLITCIHTGVTNLSITVYFYLSKGNACYGQHYVQVYGIKHIMAPSFLRFRVAG